MTAGNLFFLVCASVALAGALATVLAKNPIRGAIGLLTTIVALAGMYLQLSAQFLAAIQLIVYAGAIVVLFVFVIMLLGPDAHGGGEGENNAPVARAAGGALMAALAGAFIFLLARTSGPPHAFGPARPEHGTVEAVGSQLFTQALVPFELATALLIVAALGAIAVARSAPARRKRPSAEVGETRRLFVGPLHPRDAGRPLSKEETP